MERNEQRSRAPDAAQCFFSGALQSRGPCISECYGLLGPGSAQQRHSVSKTRVNALMSVATRPGHESLAARITLALHPDHKP